MCPVETLTRRWTRNFNFASISPPVKWESWPCCVTHYGTVVGKCGTQCGVSLCAFMCTDVVSTHVHRQTPAMTPQLMAASNYHLWCIGPFTGCCHCDHLYLADTDVQG